MASPPDPVLEELREQVRLLFGRSVDEAELAAYRGRLPTMIRNVRLLAEWAPRLGDTGPAQVQRVLAEGRRG
jgi:hypothetical protein